MEKLADFEGISEKISGQTLPKSNGKKWLMLWLFSRQILLENNWFCADQISVFNVFLTEVIIFSFNNNTLKK